MLVDLKKHNNNTWYITLYYIVTHCGTYTHPPSHVPFKMAMKIDPEYGEVLFNYGNLLSDAGLYERAAVM